MTPYTGAFFSLWCPYAGDLGSNRDVLMATFTPDHVGDPDMTAAILALPRKTVPDTYGVWHAQAWLIGRYQLANRDDAGNLLTYVRAWAIGGLNGVTMQSLAIQAFCSNLDPDHPILIYPHAITGSRTP